VFGARLVYGDVVWPGDGSRGREPQVAGRAYEDEAMIWLGSVQTPEGEISPYRVDPHTR
jgi:hypothetical protein